MPTEAELRQLISRYRVNARGERQRDGSIRFLAWYAEAPYCLAEGSTRDDALADLDSFIVRYLSNLARAGAELPVPVSDREKPITAYLRVGGAVIGNLRVTQTQTDRKSTDLSDGKLKLVTT